MILMQDAVIMEKVTAMEKDIAVADMITVMVIPVEVMDVAVDITAADRSEHESL